MIKEKSLNNLYYTNIQNKTVLEKVVEFTKPLYMSFIDMTKVFDRIKLKDVLEKLNQNNIYTQENRKTNPRV